ncbi:hypothetical protein [Microcella sp.]|uniref:hypothetical protein n=1 Tax=Microcella sp. TaxID=1913979 RepID=UPI00391BFECB
MATVPPLLAQWAPAVTLEPLTPPVQPGWSRFNPSIVRTAGTTTIGVRSANYRLTDAGRYEMPDTVIRSQTVLIDLVDGESRQPRPLQIHTDRTPSSFPVQGWEDVRLFAGEAGICGLATVRDVDESGVCRIALLVPQGDDVVAEVLVDSPRPGRHEKNWIPWPISGAVRAVYSWDPLRIITIDPATGTSDLDERGSSGLGPSTRGGAGPVDLDDGETLFVVHESHLLPTGRAYLHRFVTIGGDGLVARASPRLRLTGFGVEFAAGAAREGGDLLMTFGVADREAWLARLPIAGVLERLDPVRRPIGVTA